MNKNTIEAVVADFERLMGDAMQIAWNEHCIDTGFHPGDIKHVGKTLEFTPHHWTTDAAKRLYAALQSLGYLSPSDVEAACVAAQRDAFRGAENVVLREKANWHEITGNPCERHAQAIRALSPSPGPWPRVPEGFVVAETATITAALEFVDDWFCGRLAGDVDHKAEDIQAKLRAMIAAGGKP